MPLEDDPSFDEKPDPADEWKKGYDRMPVRMLDGELFGLLSIVMIVLALIFFFLNSSDRGQPADGPEPPLGVLSCVALSAGIVCAGFAIWKSHQRR